MRRSLSITRKELHSYFGSPLALIFLGSFLAATLFSVFWLDAFFARGIADVRPLFRWMPVLLIFLVGALTMRQWAEEQRSGTLEVLLTLPTSPLELVLGKFLAVVALVAIALALTLFIPITVSMLGNLDWGPVIGGYLAAILLASAYAAIGLFVSSRTDNQIVALISTVVSCGVLYIVGSAGVTEFVGDLLSQILRAVGAGSRFESIERGVVDLRDLTYYISLAGIFLTLNVASLGAKRWGHGHSTLNHRRAAALTTSLLALNLALLNVWIYPLRGLRLDLTSQREYSLSPVTKELLSNLQEPLLIRGFFSEKTHPMLAPLVPAVRDVLREYAIASGGKVQLDLVDPATDPVKEAEANQTYGIQPTPFRISGRYEASVINSYFDILIRYGDQSVTLSFRDLVEVEQRRDGSTDVRLRNLEYDLTRSIKKVVYGFQSVEAVLAGLKDPVQLTLYATPRTLPEGLGGVPATIQKVAKDIERGGRGKFTFNTIDPDAANAGITRRQLLDTYGLEPIATSLFSSQTYFLQMVLKVGDKAQVLYPPEDMSEAGVKLAIESVLKRLSPGFLQVVALWLAPAEATQNAFGQEQQPINSWQALASQLSEEYELRAADLTNGEVTPDVDVLVLVAPEGMTDVEKFAVDQYLMRGGAVVVAAGNYLIQPDEFTGGLRLRTLESGLNDMLASYGLDVGKQLVMDPQNEPFPVPVVRTVGGVQVREIRALGYPFFVDVRQEAMATDSAIVSQLPAITLNWVSPITVDAAKNANRHVTTLLKSSSQSWLRNSIDVEPDYQTYPDVGFAREGEARTSILAVSVQGAFESFFKGKPSPLSASGAPTSTTGVARSGTVLPVSPESARLVVIGSAEFLDDVVFQISSSLSADRYLNSLRFIQNAVDWSVEDLDLLGIRVRGISSRLLPPLTERTQSIWEGANYAVALLALAAIGVFSSGRRRAEKPIALAPRTASDGQQEVTE